MAHRVVGASYCSFVWSLLYSLCVRYDKVSSKPCSDAVIMLSLSSSVEPDVDVSGRRLCKLV